MYVVKAKKAEPEKAPEPEAKPEPPKVMRSVFRKKKTIKKK